MTYITVSIILIFALLGLVYLYYEFIAVPSTMPDSSKNNEILTVGIVKKIAPSSILNTKPKFMDPIPEINYPYVVKYTTVLDDINLAYVDEGRGKHTILFVHGLGSYLKGWIKNIDELKKYYRCIALDLPGYGKSSRGNYSYDMSFHSRVVRSFIEKKNLKHVILVGHSMGGQVSMTTVLNSSERINKLILVAPAGIETFSEAEKILVNNFYHPSLLKAATESQIKRNFKLNFFNFPEDANFMIEDRFLLKETKWYDTYCEMIPKCVLGMLNQPVFNKIDKIDIPTLIIYGENDMLIPNKLLHPNLSTTKVGKMANNKIPNSSLKMVRRCGHFAQWNQAEEVNELMKEFVG
ncbi:MAG: alpha/beta hydrolase [Bacteroidota bacterium]